MKFFKDLLNKNNEEEVLETQTKEQEEKRKERKERKQKQTQNSQKQNTKITYKKEKKEQVIRENKPEDFENKLDVHNVNKTEDTANANVEWKQKKVKKLPVRKRKDREEKSAEELFGVEIKDINIGDVVIAEVLTKSREGYIVSLEGTYLEAILENGEIESDIQVGDKVEVVVYRRYSDEYYVSNRRLARLEMIKVIEQKFDEGEIVTAKVLGFKRNKFEVKIDDAVDAHVYVGNIDNKFVNEENASDYIGNTYDFAIIKKLNSPRFKFELSRTKLLNAELSKVIENLEVGEEITAMNLKVNKAGLEFDFSGVRGFIPLKEVSNSFVEGVEAIPNFVNMDEEVPVQIIELKKDRRGTQIIASIRSLQPSPWNNFIEKYADNSVLEAEITEIRHYGFMVKLDCDIKTLLHKNNMSTEMAAEFKNYSAGNKFDVKIEEIDFDQRRVNITTSFGNEEITEVE